MSTYDWDSGNNLATTVRDAAGNAAKIGTAANIAAASSANALLTVHPGNWSVKDQATAGTPSASKAAGATGVRHVCTGISISVAAAGTAQPAVIVNLRDGATGAGTIIATWALAAPVNSAAQVSLSGLNLIGTAATAMTLEFAGATAAASVGSAVLLGYSVS